MRNDAPNKYAKFRMRLCFMKGRLEGTELVNKTSERPYVRLRVVCLFLHELGRHIIWRLIKYEIKVTMNSD
jgi:hypothetical protein